MEWVCGVFSSSNATAWAAAFGSFAAAAVALWLGKNAQDQLENIHERERKKDEQRRQDWAIRLSVGLDEELSRFEGQMIFLIQTLEVGVRNSTELHALREFEKAAREEKLPLLEKLVDKLDVFDVQAGVHLTAVLGSWFVIRHSPPMQGIETAPKETLQACVRFQLGHLQNLVTRIKAARSFLRPITALTEYTRENPA